MAALAIMAPQPYGDPNLPVENIDYVQPIAGALFDFASDSVSVDEAVQSWYSLTSAHAFKYNGASAQRPIVGLSGAVRYLNFDGVNDRLDLDATLAGPFLLIAVYRTPTPSGYPIGSGGIGNLWNMGAYVGGAEWAFSQVTPIIPGPTPDTNWHVHMVQYNGASSSYKLDSAAPSPGSVGTAVLSHVRLGAGASTYLPLQLARFAVVPGVVSAARQAQIATQLMTKYGL